MILFEHLESSPQSLAITDLTLSRSWQELNHQVLAMAQYLTQEKGLEPNDHIALLIGNRVEFIEAMLAGILAGLWVTPINTHLVAGEAGYILEDSGAKLLLHDNAHSQLISSSDQCEFVNVETLSNSLLAQSAAPMPDEQSPAGGTMLYTSGTTGRPKGVKRNKPATLKDAFEKMAAGGRQFGLTGSGPHLVTGPLYHAAPMLFALYDMLNGAPMIIMPKWDAQGFLDCVEKFKVTTSHLVPTMFVRLLKHREQLATQPNLSSLQLALHGAAPIAPSTKQAMIDWWGKILVEYWGGSEAGTTTLVTSEEWLQHPGTVGKPLSHFEVYVGDEQGNKISDGVGPLYCRHQHLAQVFEYHKDQEKTAKAHPQPHVFCIGDIGRVDDEGFVYLSDRQSNMIISGGVNIYPAEIEQAFIEHPAVADIAVFGIPNPEWGEEVVGVVELVAGTEPSDQLRQELLTFIMTKVAKFKVPRRLDFSNQLPRTPTGKLLVRELKASYKN